MSCAPPSLSSVGVADMSRLLAPPPATLRIEQQPSHLLASDATRADWGDSLGVYKLVDGLALRGRPVWRHASGRDRWLAFTPGGWMVQNERALERLQHASEEWAERLSRNAVGAFLEFSYVGAFIRYSAVKDRWWMSMYLTAVLVAVAARLRLLLLFNRRLE